MYCIRYLVFGNIIVTDCFYSISCISSLHARLVCATKYFFVTYLLTSSVIFVIFSLRATILINLNLNLNLICCVVGVCREGEGPSEAELALQVSVRLYSSFALITTHRPSTSMYSLTFRIRVTTPTQYGRNGTAHAAGASILSRRGKSVFAGSRDIVRSVDHRFRHFVLDIFWYHSKGNWLRYNFAAESFYNIKKLCSRRFVFYCRNCPKDDKLGDLSPF